MHKNISNTFLKKYKNITHKIDAIAPNNSKRSRVSIAKTRASKYKHKQTPLLSSKESKLKPLSTKISNTNSLLEYSLGFRHTFTPKKLVLPTKQVTITTTYSKPTLKKHLKKPIEAAKVTDKIKR